MAFISLDQMYSAWKRVSDWVSGTSNDKPKVEVTNFPTPVAVQKVEVQGNYVGYSTESKPTNAVKGNTYLELDTKKVFIYDGTKWVVF